MRTTMFRRIALATSALLIGCGATAAVAADRSPSPNGVRGPSSAAAAAAAAVAATPGSDLAVHTVSPCRLVDTRVAGGALSASSRDFTVVSTLTGQGGSSSGCGVPTTAVAIVANVTAVPQGKTGFLTAYPQGITRPTASTVNYATSGAIANSTTVSLSSSGKFTVYSNVSAHAVVDVIGYYTKPLYGLVTPSGGIFNGISSGIVSIVHFATGSYTITFNRSIRYCAITSADLDFDETHDISVDQSAGETQVSVRVTDAGSNLADTYFDIVATC